MLPQPDYGAFLEAMKECMEARQLQPHPWFIEKVIQVWYTFYFIFTVQLTAVQRAYWPSGLRCQNGKPMSCRFPEVRGLSNPRRTTFLYPGPT